MELSIHLGGMAVERTGPLIILASNFLLRWEGREETDLISEANFAN